MEIDLSIIITTYNDSIYLKKSLSSILDQTYIPKEIIIVDDGSKDDQCLKIINKYFYDSIVKIKYFKKVNGGPSSARNFGIKKSTCSLISFLDVDDYLLSNNIEIKYNIINKLNNNEYFGVYTSSYINNISNAYDIIEFDGIPPTHLIGRKKGIPGGVFSYLFFKNNIERIGYFDETLKHNEDFDLLIRAFKNGYKIKGNKLSPYVKNNRSTSLSRGSNYENIYNYVNIFLEKADKNNYFITEELNKRKKENNLYFAKKILIHKKQIRKSMLLIKEAFFYNNPENFKEYIIFVIQKVFFR